MQMLRANSVVDAINSSFGITPNAFYVVDVGSTTNILLSPNPPKDVLGDSP